VETRLVRKKTPRSRADLYAWCVSPGSADWQLATIGDDPDHDKRIAHEIEIFGATSAYVLLSGPDAIPIANPKDFSRTTRLADTRIAVHRHPSMCPRGVWLPKGVTAIAPLNGRPLVVARARELFFVTLYSSDTAERIEKAFDARGVDRCMVTVYGLFGGPAITGDHYERLKDTCSSRRMRTSYEHRLTENGPHAYEAHAHPELRKKYNLGLVRHP
jgi:hypothetical protein